MIGFLLSQMSFRYPGFTHIPSSKGYSYQAAHPTLDRTLILMLISSRRMNIIHSKIGLLCNHNPQKINECNINNDLPSHHYIIYNINHNRNDRDSSYDSIIDYIDDFSAPHYGVAEVLYGSIGCKGTSAFLFT